MIFKSPFQPKPFSDSKKLRIHWNNNTERRQSKVDSQSLKKLLGIFCPYLNYMHFIGSQVFIFLLLNNHKYVIYTLSILSFFHYITSNLISCGSVQSFQLSLSQKLFCNKQSLILWQVDLLWAVVLQISLLKCLQCYMRASKRGEPK